MMKYAKYGAVGLGSLLFLVLRRAACCAGASVRPFAGQPTWLRELEAPRTPRLARAAAGRRATQPTEVTALQPPVNVARRQVEDLVERDPERVAQQVRAWMAED